MIGIKTTNQACMEIKLASSMSYVTRVKLNMRYTTNSKIAAGVGAKVYCFLFYFDPRN